MINNCLNKQLFLLAFFSEGLKVDDDIHLSPTDDISSLRTEMSSYVISNHHSLQDTALF